MYVHNVSDYDLYRKLKVKAKKLTMAIPSTEKKKKCSISGYTIRTYYYLKMKNS